MAHSRNISARRGKANPHKGSTLESFLDEEGIREEVEARAITEVIAWQHAQAKMKKSKNIRQKRAKHPAKVHGR